MRNLSAMKSIFLLISCVFVIHQACSQSADQTTSQINKLLAKDFKTFSRSSQDSARINKLLQILLKHEKEHNDSTLFYAEKVIGQAGKAGLIPEISIALQEKGQYLMSKEDFSGASSCFIDALKIEEKLDNLKRIADLNDDLGAVYFNQEIFNKALDYQTKALNSYASLKDSSGMIKALSHLGSLYNSREYCEKRSSEQTKSDYETALYSEPRWLSAFIIPDESLSEA